MDAFMDADSVVRKVNEHVSEAFSLLNLLPHDGRVAPLVDAQWLLAETRRVLDIYKDPSKEVVIRLTTVADLPVGTKVMLYDRRFLKWEGKEGVVTYTTPGGNVHVETGLGGITTDPARLLKLDSTGRPVHLWTALDREVTSPGG